MLGTEPPVCLRIRTIRPGSVSSKDVTCSKSSGRMSSRPNRWILYRVSRRALDALGDASESPLFLMLHYVPPHEPYAPRSRVRHVSVTKDMTAEYDGKLGNDPVDRQWYARTDTGRPRGDRVTVRRQSQDG